MKSLRLGLAVTGSYCSFDKLEAVLPELLAAFDVLPIFSENALLDSRFGAGADWRARLEDACGRPAVTDIAGAETFGPGDALDVLAIVPCTGNTLGKLSHGVTDTAVTMAAKGHLRNGKPLVIGVFTNDGLSGSAESIARLLTRKNVYFVPFGQDDPAAKPFSLSLDYGQITPAVRAAMEGRQLQPILV